MLEKEKKKDSEQFKNCLSSSFFQNSYVHKMSIQNDLPINITKQIPIIIPGDMTRSSVHARVRSAVVVWDDALLDVNQVNFTDGLRFDDVVEIESKQFHDSSHVSAVANLKSKINKFSQYVFNSLILNTACSIKQDRNLLNIPWYPGWLPWNVAAWNLGDQWTRNRFAGKTALA